MDSLALYGKFSEPGERSSLQSSKLKMAKSSRDVLEKGLQPFFQAQEAIGSKGLHQALCRSFPEKVSEGSPTVIPIGQSIIKR